MQCFTFLVWFRALFDKMNRVFGKLPQRYDQQLIDVAHLALWAEGLKKESPFQKTAVRLVLTLRVELGELAAVQSGWWCNVSTRGYCLVL
jgi:hypothetical protein